MLNQIDLTRADLNLLVLFQVVLQECHVGRAARRMNLTPSAISHGLGRLRRLLNDPLFLRTPKGVVPTARATELAAAIADVLARASSVIATAEPFDPARSTRRFTIGAPDGVSAVLLPALLAHLGRAAPGVDISVRQLLPVPGTTSPQQAWASAFSELESRALDLAIIPTEQVPPRFHCRALYEEDFVVVLRKGHPHARRLTLERYCAMQHLVVSASGDPQGFVDQVLAAQGRSRRTALTLPNFTMAIAAVADSDLVCVVPRRFAAVHAARFGLAVLEAPPPLGRFRLQAIVPQAAMLDLGLAWLVDTVERAAAQGKGAGGPRARKRPAPKASPLAGRVRRGSPSR
jgi:DNA-binding transcriptional LysR family regulator